MTRLKKNDAALSHVDERGDKASQEIADAVEESKGTDRGPATDQTINQTDTLVPEDSNRISSRK